MSILSFLSFPEIENLDTIHEVARIIKLVSSLPASPLVSPGLDLMQSESGRVHYGLCENRERILGVHF